MPYRLTAFLILVLAGCAQLPPLPQTNKEPEAIAIPLPSEPSKPACECGKDNKPEPVKAVFRAEIYTDLPAWPGDTLNESWKALQTGCTALSTKAQWQEICLALPNIGINDRQAFLENHLTPYRILNSNGQETGLITGYYEPLLTGSLQYKPGRAPILGVPDDLLTIDLASLYPELKNMRLRGRIEGNKVVPYYDRADIDSGKAPAVKTLAWADDPIELFFLQIQGSGRLRLEDGSLIRLGYADQNGQPYKSIGKWLIEKGELKPEQASMQGIQSWARKNPQRLAELLNQNPSYVFFRILPNNEGGPFGALGVPLTDGASIAIDPRHIPLGAPVFLATTRPNSSQPLNRLVMAQDTGGAIRGPIRADFFWGYGQEAGQLAGRMKQNGKMWLLWPNGTALPGETIAAPVKP